MLLAACRRIFANLPIGYMLVITYGSAAASMAAAVDRHWRRPLYGLVVCRYWH